MCACIRSTVMAVMMAVMMAMAMIMPMIMAMEFRYTNLLDHENVVYVSYMCVLTVMQ